MIVHDTVNAILQWPSWAAWLALPALGMGILLLAWGILRRPWLGVAGILYLSTVRPSLLDTLGFGEVSIRFVDLAFLLTAAGILRRNFAKWRRGDRLPTLDANGVTLALCLLGFLLWAGVSLFSMIFTVPNQLAVSVVSYARLLWTAALIPLTFLSLENRRQAEHFVTVIIAVLLWTSLQVCLDLILVVLKEPRWWSVLNNGVRVSGPLDENTAGLICGLTFLAGLCHPATSQRWLSNIFRIGLLLSGLVGLVATKSVSSLLATGVALSVIIFVVLRRHMPTWSLWGIAVLFLVIAVGVIHTRYDDMVGLFIYGRGTVAHRAVCAAAGGLMALENPLLGVGWMNSFTTFSSDPELRSLLMLIMFDFPRDYALRESGLHNMYIQLTAETGVVGLLLFCGAIWGAGKLIKSMGGVSRPQHWCTRFAGICALAQLVWWIQLPLFGGQFESIYIACLLGVILACSEDYRSQECVGCQAICLDSKALSLNGDLHD